MKKTHIFLGTAVFAVAVFFACTYKVDPNCDETGYCAPPEEPGENPGGSTLPSGNSSSSAGDYNPGANPPIPGIVYECEDDEPASSAPTTPGGTGNAGSCVPPPGQTDNGASFPSGKETCITVGGKCYKCNPERGEECLSGWLWDGKQVDSDWWFTEVSCGGSGGAAAALTCSGFSSVPAGVEVSAPTVNCGSATLGGWGTSTSLEWIRPNYLDFSSPAQGCYNVKVKAISGNCSGQTASCGKLIVGEAQALTCANVPASGIAGQTITSPRVNCGSAPVSFSDIAWASSPNINWSNPAVGAYTNVKATPTSGNCKGQTASCLGTITVTAATTTPSSSSVGGGGASSSSVGGGGGGNCGGGNYPALASGSKGWASRYWDGCKQSCSWGGKQQYPPLASSDRCKTCEKNGSTQIAASDMNKSACDGGNSYTCFDFTPCKVNDNLAYAFAASPTDQCGKCFQLTFDGGFQHGTANATHAAVKGKSLVVMTSNMGGDVGAGQFDILIPGGGVGQFDAFSSQIGVSKASLGEQYGGLLSACEKENNYNSSQYASCLTTKCNSVFSSNAALKEGCLFYVDWFKAANNPTMIYKEVACPQYLLDKYKATMK